MGWIRMTGKVLQTTGEILTAEGFEEWAEQKGSALIEQYASNEVKGFFKKRKARQDVKQAFKVFASHQGFAAKLDSLLAEFPEFIANTFATVESNEYTAKGKLYAVPRYIAHRQFDIHVRANIARSGDYSTLNEKLSTGTGAVVSPEDAFVEYFAPKFQEELIESISSIKFSNEKNWIGLTKCWMLIGCDTSSLWRHEEIKGHYFGLVKIGGSLSKEAGARINEQLKSLSVQIFDQNMDVREKIAAILEDATQRGKQFSLERGPSGLWVD